MEFKNNDQAYLRLATKNGIRIGESPARPRAGAPGKRRAVHCKKRFKRNVLTFPMSRLNHALPPVRGDTAPLAPFLDSPLTDADVFRHLGKGIPEIHEIGDGIGSEFCGHDPIIDLDRLSGQARTSRSVTKKPRMRTISPMGKATTPTSFKVLFCQRVKSARITAGMSQVEVAAELRIPADTYSKYERRSLPPHFLIPQLCSILEIEADFLFTGRRDRKMVAGELRAV